MREDLKSNLIESYKRTILYFYKYVIIKDQVEMRQKLYIQWDKLNIKGRI